MSAQPTQPMESEDSTKPIPPKKVRFKQKARNGNSRAKNDDAFRTRIGKKVEADYHAQRAAKFTSKLPNDLFELHYLLLLDLRCR